MTREKKKKNESFKWSFSFRITKCAFQLLLRFLPWRILIPLSFRRFDRDEKQHSTTHTSTRTSIFGSVAANVQILNNEKLSRLVPPRLALDRK